MKIWKLCFIVDDGWSEEETFEETWFATEYELRKHWASQAESFVKEEDEQWAEYGLTSKTPEAAFTMPLSDLLELTERDGYSIQEYTIPDYEPVFRDGVFCIEKVDRKEICGENGKTLTFTNIKEAEQYIKSNL